MRSIPRLSLTTARLIHLTGQHGGANDLGVLAAKAVLAEAEKSGNPMPIAAAKEALKAAEAKAKETSAGKAAGGAAGGAYSRRATARAGSHILCRPGPGEPSGFLVVPGRAEHV